MVLKKTIYQHTFTIFYNTRVPGTATDVGKAIKGRVFSVKAAAL